MKVQQIKQRFGIIGNSIGLNRALEVASQVAPTDISVLVTGESGTGKEIIPQVIHQIGARKHKSYIAVNCGAIPEGTIDSELFGHEKGAFTGASGTRKGYFEVADGGTIFLDEVAELPMQTQIRLLRVLETGEFIKVGSSKVLKTNVRVVAATNENMQHAIKEGKFREDLFYRLSTVPIELPPLRNRKQDIQLLFRKFASDFAEKYRMPTIRLTEKSTIYLEQHKWPGNIRQLKNITEQISVIENERIIDRKILESYLPMSNENLPILVPNKTNRNNNFFERDLLYKVLFNMRNDITELKKLVIDMLKGDVGLSNDSKAEIITKLYHDIDTIDNSKLLSEVNQKKFQNANSVKPEIEAPQYQIHEEIEESLSLEEKEKELIVKALNKHKGKRKFAASDLGISERTLYRKIKEYKLK